MSADERGKEKTIDESSQSSLISDCQNSRISTPSPNDVLLGRGGYVNNHVGNIQFRDFVKEKKPEYLALNTTKNMKSDLAAQIVAKIRSLDPPGRFLEFHKDSNMWSECGDQKARKKASQALREQSAAFQTEFVRRDQAGLQPYFYPYPPLLAYPPFPPHHLVAGQYPHYHYFPNYLYPHYPPPHAPWTNIPPYFLNPQQNQQSRPSLPKKNNNDSNLHNTRNHLKSPFTINKKPTLESRILTDLESTETNLVHLDNKKKENNLEDGVNEFFVFNSSRTTNNKSFKAAHTAIAHNYGNKDSTSKLKNKRRKTKTSDDQIYLSSTSQYISKARDGHLEKDSLEQNNSDRHYFNDDDIQSKPSQLNDSELLSWVADSFFEINNPNENVCDQQFVSSLTPFSNINELGSDSPTTLTAHEKQKNIIEKAEKMDVGDSTYRVTIENETKERIEKNETKSILVSESTSPISNTQKSDHIISPSEMTRKDDVRKEKKSRVATVMKGNNDNILDVGKETPMSGAHSSFNDTSHNDYFSFKSVNTFGLDELEIVPVYNVCESAVKCFGDYFFRIRMKKPRLRKIMIAELGGTNGSYKIFYFPTLFNKSCTTQ